MFFALDFDFLIVELDFGFDFPEEFSMVL